MFFFIVGLTLEHPGALTESDLLSWNWSSHGDSSLSHGDSVSMTNDYCEIIKQISEYDYDSGKDSDILTEKSEIVEVCEEETQVGQSLLHIPITEEEAKVTMSSGSDKSSDTEVNDNRVEETRHFEIQYNEFQSNSSNYEAALPEIVDKEEKKEDSIVENTDDILEDNSELYNEKDRMLSDLSVKLPITENNNDINNFTEMDKEELTKKSSSEKREKIEAPVREAVISGPLYVCLSLGSEWKRRYLTIVDDCLYIWTSYK